MKAMLLTFLQRVKPVSRIPTVFAGFTVVLFLSFAFQAPPDTGTAVHQWYEKKLAVLQDDLRLLAQRCNDRQPLPSLKAAFLRARLTYKQLSVLTDYFNVYESRFLNGAALPRVEEDQPETPIAPRGFAVLEAALFAPPARVDYARLEAEAVYLVGLTGQLMNEPDKQYKFGEAAVWDALRSATLGVMTLGITGFDSPVARYSLAESKAVLEGVEALVALYRLPPPQQTLLRNRLAACKASLEGSNNFAQFDRLQFLTDAAQPLYSALVQTRQLLQYNLPEEKRPVNTNDTSLFSDRLFNIDFFSPNEKFGVTGARQALGRQLFYDPILSGTGNRSCASCHQPQLAFTDGLPRPLSVDGKTPLTRNTPTLWYAALQTRQFYDSRTSKLENQLSEVVHNTAEMKGSLKAAAGALQSDADYAGRFRSAYPGEKEPISEYTIANAISSYVRTLAPFRAPFDQYMRGDRTALGAKEKKGFNLFAGKAGCATCHFLPLFNGLVPPRFNETESEVLGVPESTQKPARIDPDEGKFLFTRAPLHRYAFKTPTLRNIARTAPYMHNGVFATLEEVIDFYDRGGGAGLQLAIPHQTLPPDKLGLSRKEKEALLAFLHALTDRLPAQMTAGVPGRTEMD